METVGLRKRVLVVDCDVRAGTQLKQASEAFADVDVLTSFHAARRLLLQRVAGVLVTNLRLAEFSGLHLVYLASIDAPAFTRCIVYSDFFDLRLVQEAQAAGAMYEPASSLPLALPSYLADSWPPRDRRSPLRSDRRRIYRGGRRATDVSVSTSV
jgi:hypothetical protein